MSRDEAIVAMASGDPTEVSDALLSLAHYDPDWRWVEERCLEFAKDANADIRATAVLCFSHLARIHGRLDFDKVLPLLRELSKDKQISGRVEDVLDDLDSWFGKR